MKRTAFLLSLVFSIFFFSGCEDDREMTILDMSQTVSPQITTPTSGSFLTLSQETADEPFVVEWTPASYNISNISEVRYILQWDVAGNNFANARDLVNTSGQSWTSTLGAINQRLMAIELEPDVEVEIEFRVYSFITRESNHTFAFSNPVRIAATPYTDFVFVKPIYMLGNGTAAGWNNNNALEMFHIEAGVFSLVATLGEAGDMVKFISVLGAWAPQWGAASGTAEEGILAYRPTEDVPDPDPINIAELVPGDYRVVADTANLTYNITKVTEVLYLLGSATSVGWDNANPLALTKDAPGKFSIETTLTAGADNGFKFLEVPGQWAPQYGTDDEGTWEEGKLVYRETESVPDPPFIPAPENTGTYLIEVNLSNMTYKLTAR